MRSAAIAAHDSPRWVRWQCRHQHQSGQFL